VVDIPVRIRNSFVPVDFVVLKMDRSFLGGHS
jgi:hypothetical protein